MAYFASTTTTTSSTRSVGRQQQFQQQLQQQLQQQQQQIQQQQVYSSSQQYYQQQRHYNTTVPAVKMEDYRANPAPGYANLQQQQPRPQQHVNEQLKQMLVEREYREPPVPSRLQPTTSSNRSMSRERPVPPPHQANVFYPATTELRSSMRGQQAEQSAGVARSNSSNAMPESMSASVVSISSTTSSQGSFQQVNSADWNVEQVGSWLRSIGLESYTVHFAANGVRGDELLTMESPRMKLLVPHTHERSRLKQRLKELRAAADKDKRSRERERKEREKLQRKAEKLAEKASKKK